MAVFYHGEAGFRSTPVNPEAFKQRALLSPNPASDFITAARSGSYSMAHALLMNRDFDINYQDEKGRTALHYAAALDDVPLLRLITKSLRCDYTLMDERGRTPAALAYEYANNPITGRFLLKKEYAQRRNPMNALII